LQTVKERIGIGRELRRDNEFFKAGRGHESKLASIGVKSNWLIRGKPQQRVSASVFDFLRRSGAELLPASRAHLMLDRFFLNLAFTP